MMARAETHRGVDPNQKPIFWEWAGLPGGSNHQALANRKRLEMLLPALSPVRGGYLADLDFPRRTGKVEGCESPLIYRQSLEEWIDGQTSLEACADQDFGRVVEGILYDEAEGSLSKKEIGERLCGLEGGGNTHLDVTFPHRFLRGKFVGLHFSRNDLHLKPLAVP